MSVIRAEGLGLERNGYSILRDITWSAEEGSRWCILGENGAGKTSLLECMSGFETGFSGRLSVQGKELGRREVLLPGAAVSYQQLPFSGLFSLREFLELSRLTPAAIEAALEAFELQKLAGVSLAGLSGGEKRRASVAAALFSGHSLIMLDEPSVFLDHRSRFLLRGVLHELGSRVTLVLISHDIELARHVCTDFMALKDGALEFTCRHEELDDDRLARLWNIPPGTLK